MGVQKRTDNLYDQVAREYESQPGHGIGSNEERQAWLLDLAPILERLPGKSVVDVGCGTGVLTRLLADAGYSVQGIDSSSEMIEVAWGLLTSDQAQNVSFTVGDAHDCHLEPAAFDAVMSRQVVCHLHDPMRAFRRWHEWLKPDGMVVVIDGFWSRQGWATGKLADDLDNLPLCCVQTLGTVAYLLEQTGFVVEHRGWLEEVNRFVAHSEPGAIQRSPRYIVVARKSAVRNKE